MINHKFMTSGHSYLQNDSDFVSIQKFGKRKLIYTPVDWYFAIAKSHRICGHWGGDQLHHQALEKMVVQHKKN
jgi:hypothetical protein